jgi:6-methylsalicylate decarboxylase
MFRRIYWDTALAASDPVLQMLRDVAGINQVLYGTDFPYLRRDLAVSSKQRILQSTELNDSKRRTILGGNPASRFRRPGENNPVGLGDPAVGLDNSSVSG